MQPFTIYRPLLVPSAYSTARKEEACDMNSPPPLPGPLPRGERECENQKYLEPEQRIFSAPGERVGVRWVRV